jgi:hypothetical protein
MNERKRKPCLTIGINTDEKCYEVTGNSHFDGNVYCENCLEWWNTWYPQGWVSYPGDTCTHGTYVGGCGFDYMCNACEFSEEDNDSVYA